MRYTVEGALEKVAQKTYDNTQELKQTRRQRRHQVTDLYGVEMTRQGDSGTPASFYISISPDMVYLERFEFKLIVQPFASYSDGMESTVVDVKNTALSVSGNSVSPDPHGHDTAAHTHNLTNGITLTHTTAADFRVSIEGIDVTEYLMAQFGNWIDGEGVYPSLSINANFDVLEVASDMMAEGRDEDAEALVHPGYKKVQVTSDAPFQITLVNYLKYSHLNR